MPAETRNDLEYVGLTPIANAVLIEQIGARINARVFLPPFEFSDAFWHFPHLNTSSCRTMEWHTNGLASGLDSGT